MIAVDDTELQEFFKEHFYLTCVGRGLWRAYNRETGESASPVYNSREAAVHFVICEQKAQLTEAIDGLLGVPTIPNVEE